MSLNTTAQFRVIAHLADGSSRDATEEVFWSVTDGSFFSMLSNGLVKSSATPGEASVSAYKGNGDGEVEFEASTSVIALAPGTYILKGVVWEDSSPTLPLSGAHVELRTSDGSLLTADTNFDGEYQFYGVSGSVRLRVTRDGYERVTHTFVVSRNLGYDVWLPLSKPRADISGTYTMTLTASPGCGVGMGDGNLPDGLSRVRSYRVDVKQAGPILEIRASGATLRENFSSRPFKGKVAPGLVQFDFLWYDGEPPYLVEDLPTSQILVVDGLAEVSGSGRLEGKFFGQFRVFERVVFPHYFMDPPVADCYSLHHRFELSR
jgi:hypothetical protein